MLPENLFVFPENRFSRPHSFFLLISQIYILIWMIPCLNPFSEEVISSSDPKEGLIQTEITLETIYDIILHN